MMLVALLACALLLAFSVVVLAVRAGSDREPETFAQRIRPQLFATLIFAVFTSALVIVAFSSGQAAP